MGHPFSKCLPKSDISGGIDEELIADMQEHVKIVDEKILKNYISKRRDILKEMKKASPEPYEGLLYSNYPANCAKVNALALQDVTSKTATKNITLEIYEEIKPKLDQKIAGQPDAAQNLARKSVKTSIKKAVGKALAVVVKNININEPDPEFENI